MLNLKKTALAVLAFGSSAVFAGTMGPTCAPGNVTVPCEKNAWDFGVQALYLKPSYNNDLAAFEVRSTRTTTTYADKDADWNWGFKLEGSYHFSTGNDLTLNWYHLGHDSDTERGYASYTVPAVGTLSATSDAFTLKTKWDAVNAEFGQHVDFGEFKKIRFHGGVQYARINTDTLHASNDALYTTNNSITSGGYTLSSASKYSGFGPRIGADYSYELGNGLAVYAKGASTILAGTSKVTATASSTAVNNAAFGLPESLIASRTVLVPEVEAKLGMTYNWAVAQGDLALDVGYMWVNYFNAQQSATSADSNFGLNGPFAGLKWVGTVV